MPVEIGTVANGILTVIFHGLLAVEDLAQFHESLPRLLKQHGDFRILVRAEQLEGWGAGDWSNTSPQTQHDARIGRIAIICDSRQADLVLMFAGQGLRPAQVACFDPADLARARKWLAE